jgi:hypothetical protein
VSEVKIKPGLYRHYKGPLYRVLLCARNSNNGPDEGRTVVVYSSDAEHGYCTRYVEEFLEMVDDPRPSFEGNPKPRVQRFEWVSP